MPADAAARLSSLLVGSNTYLEYGVGGSTQLAARAGPATLIGVDSDRRFLEAVGRVVEQAGKAISWNPVHVDLGPTAYLGFPKTLGALSHWGDYALAPWRLGLAPDLVLIDGRFRLACALATAAHARPGTLVFFDDYATRPWYWKAARYLDPIERVGRAAVMRVPTLRDPGLEQAIRAASRNPL
ncbi:hypothetical protein [Thioalkalivibrio sp. XN8]|uniref:hypothetical protein n=1 Tax=Thioalkalivibrio sp. XN8 TaxID=2712863 RepID=UPI0013EC45B7|nr:hypothetical protein [Thioalkalivibrio sp. XN8]NGP54425.1 hypothetical protein [Thioalkalivibrio sp. XN8]